MASSSDAPGISPSQVGGTDEPAEYPPVEPCGADFDDGARARPLVLQDVLLGAGPFELLAEGLKPQRLSSNFDLIAGLVAISTQHCK